MRTRELGILCVLALAGSGCGESHPSPARPLPLAPTPLSPAPAPEPAPISLVVFRDSVSGISTSDVRDAQEQIVRFNTAGEAIWTADDSRYKGLLLADGKTIGFFDGFEVLFGTKDGERRAYLTFDMNVHHYGPPAIVADLEVVDGRLILASPKVSVPLPGS